MSRTIDSVIALRILHMLVTPFEETKAFRLGIIDAKGKELKRMNQLHTVEERDAYTILHRMIFRIKKIIEKVPSENKKLLSLTAALALIKECYSEDKEPLNLEYKYLERLEKEPLVEDLQMVEQFLNKRVILPFRLYTEEAPANNAVATPGIAGFTPETMGVKRNKKIKVLRRNEDKHASGNTKPF